MAEEKMCPFRFYRSRITIGDITFPDKGFHEGECIKERCALWLEEIGLCALATPPLISIPGGLDEQPRDS